MSRKCSISRNTFETKINLELDIDGQGNNNINTGIGFFDHMLTHISKQSFIDMNINAEGDLNVDSHHTIEDVGIVLGKGLIECLGDKKSINRYGSAIIPMDETLVMCAIDLSGRTHLNFDAKFTKETLGNMDTEMIEEFFKAVSSNAPMNLHIKVLEGKNNHHIAEGIFKAFGRALKDAVIIDKRIKGVLSTKGMLE